MSVLLLMLERITHNYKKIFRLIHQIDEVMKTTYPSSLLWNILKPIFYAPTFSLPNFTEHNPLSTCINLG
jgi:hypothetical protein